MTEEKYTQFVNSLTSTTLEGFTSEDVQSCLATMKRAFTMEAAIIRAVQTLKSAASDCVHTHRVECWNCERKQDHFCPEKLKDTLRLSVMDGKELDIETLKQQLRDKNNEARRCALVVKPVEMACGLCFRQEKCKILEEREKVVKSIEDIEKCKILEEREKV